MLVVHEQPILSRALVAMHVIVGGDGSGGERRQQRSALGPSELNHLIGII